MWFERLTGFEEGTPEQVRSNIEINGDRLLSKINNKEMIFGRLEVASLSGLRKRISTERYTDKIRVSETVGNVQQMHLEPQNDGAIFQAASQFNLLEMVGPHISPEQGIGMYENDHTQGPACAIACGAGTIFRNYFVEVNGRIGQSRENQIDCLEEIGHELENSKLLLWEMINGYALPTSAGLEKISELIHSKDALEYDALKSKLKVGIQWDTQVTLDESENSVSQVYCSALPVAYTRIDPKLWEPFARLVLEASYEAMFCAALINFEKTGNPIVYLTLVGGGAFGNARSWIFDSMKHSIEKFKLTPLDIRIVSYGGSSKDVLDFANQF